TTGAAWLFTLLVDSPLPQTGILSRCQGVCPDNPFQLVTASASRSDAAALAVAGAQALSACLVAFVLLRRLRAGAPVERVTLGGALVPLAVLALGYLLAFVLLAAGADHAAAQVGWLYAPLFAIVPIALLVGQVRGRLFAGTALRRMLAQLGPHPSPAAVEQHMATAFGDPSLRIAYRATEDHGYLDASGATLAVPDTAGPGVAELWDEGERVAVILHDPALDDVPGLMDAAGAATLLAVRNARLSAELRSSIHALHASRARIAAAVNGVRRDLEHDLADGAQRQLASVAGRLAAAVRAAADPSQRALLAELSNAADQAAQTLDDAAHGIYPRPLIEHGLVPALRAGLGSSTAILERQPLQRGPEESEAAVFFTCVEAAQNALKYAGPDSTVTVTLREHDGDLRFVVHDDGDGFDVGTVDQGSGLANIRDRIEAIGGYVAIVSSSEHGTTISGSVPWPPRQLSPVRPRRYALATGQPR
ncbi:MAG TPA: ATP-binding protein, partial [Thermoleophilaceae bacterium]